MRINRLIGGRCGCSFCKEKETITVQDAIDKKKGN